MNMGMDNKIDMTMNMNMNSEHEHVRRAYESPHGAVPVQVAIQLGMDSPSYAKKFRIRPRDNCTVDKFLSSDWYRNTYFPYSSRTRSLWEITVSQRIWSNIQ